MYIYIPAIIITPTPLLPALPPSHLGLYEQDSRKSREITCIKGPEERPSYGQEHWEFLFEGGGTWGKGSLASHPLAGHLLPQGPGWSPPMLT